MKTFSRTLICTGRVIHGRSSQLDQGHSTIVKSVGAQGGKRFLTGSVTNKKAVEFGYFQVGMLLKSWPYWAYFPQTLTFAQTCKCCVKKAVPAGFYCDYRDHKCPHFAEAFPCDTEGFHCCYQYVSESKTLFWWSAFLLCAFIKLGGFVKIDVPGIFWRMWGISLW